MDQRTSLDMFSCGRALRHAMRPRTTTNSLVSARVTEHADAWQANPVCWVCSTATPSRERSAFLSTPDGPRVTCLSPCFATAVARLNPTFNSSVALRRAGAISG